MSADGEVILRSLAVNERPELSQALRKKSQVAEWRPPKGIKEPRNVLFLVLPTAQGRRFLLSPPLSGWSGLREAVARVSIMGYWWLRAEAGESGANLDLDAAELFLHFALMPRKREFRSRRYASAFDFRPSAEAGQSLMPQHLMEAPVSTARDGSAEQIDRSTSRRDELRRVSEPVFGENQPDLLSSLALWNAEAFRSRRVWTRTQIWNAVARSVLAAKVTQGAVKRARDGCVAQLLVEHMMTVGMNDSKNMLKVFTRLHRQGFRDLWTKSTVRGKVSKEQFGRDVLNLMAGSFWTVSRCWCRVMKSIRRSIRPRLNAEEEIMFDRLYLPQRYFAGLAPLVLWPRRAIVWSLAAKFLEMSKEESWRLFSIPYCLQTYAEMDDYTRRYDRKRKRPTGREVQREKPEEIVKPSRSVATEVDPVWLKRLFDKEKGRGRRPCPDCGQHVKDIEVIEDSNTFEQLVKLLPCGCTLPIQN